jgi:hypothetical protein
MKKKVVRNKKHPIYGKSVVALSPRFQQIMERWQYFGRQKTGEKFYDEDVKLIDPNITKAQWLRFSAILKKDLQERANSIVDMVAKDQKALVDSQNRGLSKLTAIAENALDEIINDPSVLLRVPVEKRMKFIIEAAKATDRRISLGLKLKDEGRKQTMFDEFMNEARYGAGVEDPDRVVSSEDIPMEEHQEMPPADAFFPHMPDEVHVEIVANLPAAVKKEVTFDPSSL